MEDNQSANLDEQAIRDIIGSGSQTVQVKKPEGSPFWLANSSIMGSATPDERSASLAEKPAFPDSVEAVYHTDSGNRAEGRIEEKTERIIESTGHRKKWIPEDIPEQGAEEEEKEEEEEENSETVEDAAERLEKTVEERKLDGDKAMEEEMNGSFVEVSMSAGGFDIFTRFRDVQVRESGHVGIIFNPRDAGLCLPRKNSDVELNVYDRDLGRFVYTGVNFDIPGGCKLYVLFPVTPSETSSEQG